MARTAYRKTLSAAVTLAGGRSPLATRLKVSERRIEKWLEGSEPIPDDVFLRLVDIIEASKANDRPRRRR